MKGIQDTLFRTLLPTLSLLWAASALAVPRHVYLTWQGDPSTSVTINYHTLEKAVMSEVRYDTQSRAGQPGDYRWRNFGAAHAIDGLADGRLIHVVELTGLKPGGSYYFVAGNEEPGFSPEMKFRTVPDTDEAIRFVVGGDMGISRHARKMVRIAAGRDPLFAAIGGDLAYANGRLSRGRKWDRWFDNWRDSFVSPDGFMVPMILAIGNHEVQDGYGQPPEKAPFYFGYFRQGAGEGRAYFSKRIGKRVALYLLDSGHIAPHGGLQAAWLESEMAGDGEVSYRLAIYHVPLYPASRPFEGEYHRLGRAHWLPLFDRYKLTLAFEHHDHVLKRTFPLRAGERNPRGTVYLGDGCFGRSNHKLRQRQYLAFSRQIRHFWLVEADREPITFEAIDAEGRVVDRYSIRAGSTGDSSDCRCRVRSR